MTKLGTLVAVALVAFAAGSAGAQLVAGQQGSDSPGVTYPGSINLTYLVLGSQAGGYSGQGCYFQLPAGKLTIGALYDCGLIDAPTPTTMASSWRCWYTYTVTSTTSPNAFVGGRMSGCGTMAPGATEWLAASTNAPGPSPAGFSSCGGSPCTGTAPTSPGTGTYPYRTIAAPYGTRSGLGTATLATGSKVQMAQYVTLGPPGALASISLSAAGNAPGVIASGSNQLSVSCVNSDGSTTCPSDAPTYSSSNPAVGLVTVAGIFEGLAQGVTQVTAMLDGVSSAPLPMAVIAFPAGTYNLGVVDPNGSALVTGTITIP